MDALLYHDLHFCSYIIAEWKLYGFAKAVFIKVSQFFNFWLQLTFDYIHLYDNEYLVESGRLRIKIKDAGFSDKQK